MISVQAAGCAPITRAFEQDEQTSQFWQDASTVASGLRVPKALGDFLVLRAIRESGGVAVSVTDSEMLESGLQLAATEGIFPAPEGGACVAAATRLRQSGFLSPDSRVVLFNTGSGYKYLEAYGARFSRSVINEYDKLGGLITPR